MNIPYLYIKELAPTNDIRQKQKDADKLKGETKKLRTTIGETFKAEYIKQILELYDFDALIKELKRRGSKNIVFFCVEENAKACHRSLVAEKLSNLLGSNIINL